MENAEKKTLKSTLNLIKKTKTIINAEIDNVESGVFIDLIEFNKILEMKPNSVSDIIFIQTELINEEHILSHDLIFECENNLIETLVFVFNINGINVTCHYCSDNYEDNFDDDDDDDEEEEEYLNHKKIFEERDEKIKLARKESKVAIDQLIISLNKKNENDPLFSKGVDAIYERIINENLHLIPKNDGLNIWMIRNGIKPIIKIKQERYKELLEHAAYDLCQIDGIELRQVKFLFKNNIISVDDLIVKTEKERLVLLKAGGVSSKNKQLIILKSLNKIAEKRYSSK